MSAVLKSFEAVNSSRADLAPLIIAVAGNPNAGKTSLFNSLTGLRQRVANYPGVTVERKTGLWIVSPDLPPAELIDLPGLYSLNAASIDEQIARDILLSQTAAAPQPDVIIVVVDATNIVRNLYLATQLIETGRPVVVALTMFDLAEREKLNIDVEKLSARLGVPVVPVVANKHRGLKELAEAVLTIAAQRHAPTKPELFNQDQAEQHHASLIRRYALIERIVSEAVETNESKRGVSERIDAIVTHKFLGPVILLLVMLFIFQAIFSWADFPMRTIDQTFTALAAAIHTHFPPGVLTDLLADGIIAGVGSVLVFLPQIFLLFFFISLLEDSGYMARAAFLIDRPMRALGLQGKAFMPLLSSFACAVPGIMATRTIENPRERLATIMIAPFMSCSARLPVYTLMIATFFSGQRVLRFVSVGALIILAMYLLGITVAIGVGWILKHTILKRSTTPFLLELPPYRMPHVANVGHALLQRTGIFVKRAGTVILAISILLWALSAFPRARTANTIVDQAGGTYSAANKPDDSGAQIRNSYAGRAGRLIEPVISPLGFDWRIGIGLISSFAARETIISTLSIVYNVGADSSEKSTSLIDAMRAAKRPDGSLVWTPLVGLSLMVFFVLACQCMSTVAIVRRETNSWRWPLFMVGYMLVLAYAASFITFQGGRLLGFS